MTSKSPRLYEALKVHGLGADQPVSFFSNGQDTLHRLQMYLSPQAEYILDWFHITMRLPGMSQMRKGMAGTEAATLVTAVEKDLESLKWHYGTATSIQRCAWWTD